MSSSESLKAIHDETRKRLTAGVLEQITVAINRVVMQEVIYPEGDEGQIEIAFKIDRQALTIEAMRTTIAILQERKR